ncbi:MAG: Flp family type IVb pilin [Alphaproteobacteria bacterium]
MLIANLRSLIADESGATAIEYGLIAALVSVAAIGALGAMGESLETMFENVSNALDTAVTAPAPAEPPAGG